MYRCVALLSLRDPARRRRGSRGVGADRADEDGRVLLDGEDVSDAIRAPEVSEAASEVAAEPAVRAALVREAAGADLAHGDWVAEGRDIGTVVAPGAELKVYLDADPAERARRRAAESGAEQAGVLDGDAGARRARPQPRGEPAAGGRRAPCGWIRPGSRSKQVVERIAELAGRPR